MRMRSALLRDAADCVAVRTVSQGAVTSMSLVWVVALEERAEGWVRVGIAPQVEVLLELVTPRELLLGPLVSPLPM